MKAPKSEGDLLFYHAGAVGDVITTLPALKTWRENRPRDRIIFLGKPAIGRLLVASQYADAAWNVDRADFLHLYSGATDAALCEKLKPVSSAILIARDRFELADTLRVCGVESVVHQQPFPEKMQHIVEYRMELVKGVFPLLSLQEPVIPIHRVRVDRKGKNILLHHGSGSRLKNWPKANFRRLADRLKNVGYRISWIKGPADDPPPADGRDSVLETNDLIECLGLLNEPRLCLYIGNDSGLTHLAAASGCPTVAIFGASDPRVWAPLGEHVTVIASKAVCAPCHPNKISEKHCGVECMSAISVEQVYGMCRQVLSGYRLRQERE